MLVSIWGNPKPASKELLSLLNPSLAMSSSSRCWLVRYRYPICEQQIKTYWEFMTAAVQNQNAAAEGTEKMQQSRHGENRDYQSFQWWCTAVYSCPCTPCCTALSSFNIFPPPHNIPANQSHNSHFQVSEHTAKLIKFSHGFSLQGCVMQSRLYEGRFIDIITMNTIAHPFRSKQTNTMVPLIFRQKVILE